jgi:hypothetical protein
MTHRHRCNSPNPLGQAVRGIPGPRPLIRDATIVVRPRVAAAAMAVEHQVPVAAAQVPVVQERAAQALAAQERAALVQAVALAAVRVADPAAVGAAAEVAVPNNLVTEKAPVHLGLFPLFSSFNLASRIALQAPLQDYNPNG